MTQTIFLDTSILCNILQVPQKSQHALEVLQKFKQLQVPGNNFIIPITAVIETGNFIAQLADGGERRALAEKFEQFLRKTAENEVPFVLHAYQWDKTFIESFLDGAGTCSSYVDHAMQRVGAGDLCILTEMNKYKERIQGRGDIVLWSLDINLSAHVTSLPV